MAGGEELVVVGERQDEAAVHVDELGGEDEALVEVGTVDRLEDDIGVEGFSLFAVVDLRPGHFDPIGTTAGSLLEGAAERCLSAVCAANNSYIIVLHE